MAAWVLRDAGSKYLASQVPALAKSARAVSVCRDNKLSRAFNSRSLRFSRKKNDCSGDNKAASGCSIRLTRSSALASSRTACTALRAAASSRCLSNQASSEACTCPFGPAVGVATVGVFCLADVFATMALATGSSSAMRVSSSILIISTGTSVRLAALMRSRSLASARCKGFSRGCAARCRRWAAVVMAAIKGTALPVNWACCCASRKADSMSTTRFSSRERDRLCISSSSWARCKLTSLIRFSCKASRAVSSRALSCAALASVRASIDWAPESKLRRASSS